MVGVFITVDTVRMWASPAHLVSRLIWFIPTKPTFEKSNYSIVNYIVVTPEGSAIYNLFFTGKCINCDSVAFKKINIESKLTKDFFK